MAKHYHNIEPPPKIKLLLVAEAPPPEDKPENYFYNVSDGPAVDGRKRGFFRELMRGVGLISESSKVYNERKVLDAFLEAEYFLIDTCPIAIPSGENKEAFMMSYANSLLQAIKEFNPEKLLFMCKTNEIIIELLRHDKEISSKLVQSTALPFPGFGNQKRFRDEFPKAFKLRAIY
jgi:hypothetical protein